MQRTCNSAKRATAPRSNAAGHELLCAPEVYGSTLRVFFGRGLRAYYRALPAFHSEAAKKPNFCPGNSWFSLIAHEPAVSVSILNEMLSPYIADGRIMLDDETVAVDSAVENDVIQTVTVRNQRTGEEKRIEAAYFLDAADEADPADLQAITWVAARLGVR